MIGMKVRAQSRAATVGDVTAESMKFHFGDAFQVKGAVVQVSTSAGVAKAFVGGVTWDAEEVTVTNPGSGVAFAATDVVSVLAFGA
jgi:hypothetical protein